MTARRWAALTAALAEARARRWHRRSGVVGLGIGQRHRDGRWVDASACVVVKVAWKRDRASLPDAAAFPAWLDVRIGRTRQRIGVDVQETRGERAGRCECLVGEAVTYDGASHGAVSAVVSTQDGARVVLIAGHVAPGVGRAVELAGITGTTRTPVMTSRLDHCLVDPDAPLPVTAGWLPGDHAITGIAPVVQLALNQTLYIHHVANPARIPTVLRGVEMALPFDYASGPRQLTGLLATDGVTVRGDSGSLLYDNAFRAVGTLIGSLAGASYFIPCERAAALLAISFN